MPYGIQKTTRSLEVCLSLNYRTALTGYRKMNKYGRRSFSVFVLFTITTSSAHKSQQGPPQGCGLSARSFLSSHLQLCNRSVGGCSGRYRDGGWLGAFAKDGTQCPVVITPIEVDAAVKLGEGLEIAEENESRMLRNYVAYGPETWVPAAQYKKAMASDQEMKQKMLEVYSDDEVMTSTL